MTDRFEGDDAIRPPPTDADIAAERGRVESRLAALGLSLEDPALWLEPGEAGSEQLAAPSDVTVPAAGSSRVRWLVAAAAIVLMIAGGVLAFGEEDPDWTVTAGPTDAYPAASATINGWNEGKETRMVLDMTGVEPAPDGFFYEMWMSEGPVHISAGTFVETTGVELRAAVPRRDYPRLWVTLEPIDDDESPTSVVVVDTGA